MYNIFISKTDPYSFMGLIKASSKEVTITSSLRCLIKAGFASLFLIVAITRMAQANVEVASSDIEAVLSACSPEACVLV